MTFHEDNIMVVERDQTRARCVNIVALDATGEHQSAAAAIRNNPGARAAVEVDRRYITVLDLAAEATGPVLAKFIAEGDRILGVGGPDWEASLIFRGPAVSITRPDVGQAQHVVLPGQKREYGGGWSAIPPSADILVALNEQRSNELPALPPWFVNWLGGSALTPASRPPATPLASAAPQAPCCANCDHHRSGECHLGPPQRVVDEGGQLRIFGWLKVTPTDRCGGFRVRSTSPRSCAGCAFFSRKPRTEHGHCRVAGPVPDTNNAGTPISRDGMWPTVSETQLCGSFAAQIDEAA